MAKALFYIKGKSVPVQHVGCRLAVTKKMIHAGFKKGGAFNMPDGRVEVVLEGTREEIENMHREISENLYNWIVDAAKDREGTKAKLGNPGIKVSPLHFDSDLLVLDIGLYSHSLTFDQIYKGVDVYKELIGAIRDLRHTIAHR